MTYLLDTHTFLFAITDSPNLSNHARSIILNGENEILISAVTFWEIALKHSIGKLEIEGVSVEELPDVAERLGFTAIAVEPREACTFFRLPLTEHHKDPFDRMLVWQALQRNMPLISRDQRLSCYSSAGLRVIW